MIVADKEFEWRVGARRRRASGIERGRQEQRERHGRQGRDSPGREAWGGEGCSDRNGSDQHGRSDRGPMMEVGPMPATLRLQTEYGILGHDYTRVAADATPLSADDFEPINGLLAARLEAKRARRYDEADALMVMLAALGVAVEDNVRTWRADGVPFDRYAWTRIAGDGDLAGEAVPTGGYGTRRANGNAGAESGAAAGGAGDEGGGAAVARSASAEELGARSASAEEFGARSASTEEIGARSSSAEEIGASSASAEELGASSASAEEISAKTVPQLKALLREKGLKVGGVKAELIGRLLEAAAAEVEEEDALKTASQEEEDALKTASQEEAAALKTARALNSAPIDEAEATVAAADGAASGGGVDVAAVEALLEARGQAKLSKDYESADALVETLRSAHGVVLDDKRRTWRVVVQYGGYYRVGPQVDPYTTKQVRVRVATEHAGSTPSSHLLPRGVPSDSF